MKKQNRYTIETYGKSDWGKTILISNEGRLFKQKFSNKTSSDHGYLLFYPINKMK